MKSKLILCVLFILLMVGCADNDEPTVQKRDDFKGTSKQTEKRLNWMGHWLHEHDRAILVKEVAQNFELMNPDINVNLKGSRQIMSSRGPEITGTFLADMIKSGNIEWDVVRMNQFIYQHVAEQLDDPNCGKDRGCHLSVDPYSACLLLLFAGNAVLVCLKYLNILPAISEKNHQCSAAGP